MANAKSELKKQKALAALAESSTLTEAANKAGISRRTLYAYIREDLDFSVAYKSMQERAIIDTYEAAAEQRAKAIGVLESIMNDMEQPVALRLRAALAVIDKANKLEASVLTLARSHVTGNYDMLEQDDPFAKAPH